MQEKLCPWVIRFRFVANSYVYAIWLVGGEACAMPYMEDGKYVFSRRIAPLRQLCAKHSDEWEDLQDNGFVVCPSRIIDALESGVSGGIVLSCIDMYSDFVQDIFPAGKRTDGIINDFIIYATFNTDLKPFFKQHGGTRGRKRLINWIHYATGLMLNNAKYI